MKIIRFQSTNDPFQVLSINKVIDANIVYNHPEWTLEDESMVIFSDVETFYKFIEVRELYTQTKQELNVPKLVTYSEDVVTDTMQPISRMHKNMTSITEIPFENGKVYYVTRTGR